MLAYTLVFLTDQMTGFKIMNDILTIIKLRGPIRSPELETEIFADEKLYTCYLNELSQYTIMYFDRIHNENMWRIFRYSSDVIKGRWPEAERVIIADAQWAYNYANYVIKGRWPEAENIIATNIWCAEQYNDRFGTNI
jgi:hypothetical protein